MSYFATIEDGIIYAVGTSPAPGAAEITQARYDAIRAAYAVRPTPENGFSMQLKSDLTWDTVPLPPAALDRAALEGMTNAALSDILDSYGIAASGMTKQTMITVILLAQGGEA